MRVKTTIAAAILTLCFGAGTATPLTPTGQAGEARVDVRTVADEAEAVLAILAKTRASKPVTEADWQRLFLSEGYTRLKKREAAMSRPFTDSEFKAFVLSSELAARAPALEETLGKWKQTSVTGAANRALAYLPGGASIRAKIYPVIKPRDNSFVFEVTTDPAIFLYLDPTVNAAQFENTLAHELHHIGYGGSCPPAHTNEETAKLSPQMQSVLGWMGAFGEGFAMLAAAGEPDVHPHQSSSADDRRRWDADMQNFNADLKKVEKFFLDVLEKKLSKEEEQKAGYSFFGVQGPWYTVGWKMAVVIEKAYGKATLTESFCDKRKLLSTYNRAATEFNKTAREPLALWSGALL